MSCNCHHNREAIESGMQDFAKLRVLFIKRMTEDSLTQDRRRADYNQAIFSYEYDGTTYQVFDGTDMDMVLDCFDNAVKDWRREFCDVPNCRRKP